MKSVLAEEFNEKKPMPGMDYKWVKSQGTGKAEFPDKLYLVCKERLLLFDYFADFQGFIISTEFLKLFNRYSSMEGYQLVPLETISWKGKKITEKQYYNLFPYHKEKWVDYQTSVFQIKQGKTLEDVINKNGLLINKYEEIKLIESAMNKEVFTLSGAHLNSFLFCSEEFKHELEKAKLVGIDFISIEEFPTYYNKKYLYFL
nr:Imm43 family immunity protein [Cohnella terricola]